MGRPHGRICFLSLLYCPFPKYIITSITLRVSFAIFRYTRWLNTVRFAQSFFSTGFGVVFSGWVGGLIDKHKRLTSIRVAILSQKVPPRSFHLSVSDSLTSHNILMLVQISAMIAYSCFLSERSVLVLSLQYLSWIYSSLPTIPSRRGEPWETSSCCMDSLHGYCWYGLYPQIGDGGHQCFCRKGLVRLLRRLS
jgi:hypothetical protein